MSVLKNLSELKTGDIFKLKYALEIALLKVLDIRIRQNEYLIIVEIMSGYCPDIEDTTLLDNSNFKLEYNRVGRIWSDNYNDCIVELIIDNDELMVELL